MKNKIPVFVAMLLVCIGMTAAAAGCGGGADKAYPVSIGGVEVVVGETKVSALLDGGYHFWALAGMTSEEIDANDMLDANSYYTSIFLELSGSKTVMFAVATDKNSIPFCDATIADIQFLESADLSEVSFDGVPLTELTPEVLKEHVSGVKEKESGKGLYFSSSRYYISFNYEEDKVTEFEIKRMYDVDYSK